VVRIENKELETRICGSEREQYSRRSKILDGTSTFYSFVGSDL
jgi:hypothetical protein